MCYTVMTSSDTKFLKEQRVLIEDMATCREAVSWCEEHLEHSEFSHESFEANDCFYFTDRTICSMFILMFGGKYIAPPWRNDGR